MRVISPPLWIAFFASVPAKVFSSLLNLRLAHDFRQNQAIVNDKEPIGMSAFNKKDIMDNVTVISPQTRHVGLKSFRGLVRRHESSIALFERAMDAVLIGLALWIAIQFYDVTWKNRETLMLACAIGLFVFFAQFFDLYRSWRGASVWREVGPLLMAWLSVVLGLLMLAYTTKTSADYSRLVVLSWFITTPILLALWRSVERVLVGLCRQHGINTRRVAIVGARDLGVRVATMMFSAPWMGLRPLGFYDDRSPGGARPLDADLKQVIGNLAHLVKQAHAGDIDIVYITLPMSAEKRIQELIAKLSDTTVSVYIVPDFFMFDLFNACWTNVGDLPAVSIFETPFYGVDGWVKRVEDLVIAGLILVAVAIPMLLVAAGVKLTSPGPVIFKQRRYGLAGQMIEVWKFRTMAVCEDDNGVKQATRNDPRMTRFGTFLRRTSLDELPQFINVLQGTMSIVGPRPHAVVHNEQYRKLINGYMLRHKVKPGITGWAQINGWRGETETLDKMQGRVEHDLDYIRNWSLWLDLRIIVVTCWKGFCGRNAY